MLQLLDRAWPIAVLTFGLFITLGWIGLLGYGLIKLGI